MIYFNMKIFSSEFISFLKLPANSFKEKPKFNYTIVKQFFIFDFKLLFLFAILVTLMSFFFEDFKMVFSNRIYPKYSNFQKLTLFILVLPFIEELAFRIGLKINKINISILLGGQLVYLMSIIDILTFSIIYKISIMFFISLVSYILITNKLLNFLTKYFNYFVYYNIIMFGLVHAFNYSYSSYNHFLFIPILISFQTIMGAYLSYVRLKYSFFWGISLHIAHNLILTIPTILIGY